MFERKNRREKIEGFFLSQIRQTILRRMLRHGLRRKKLMM